jgi:hypothetical protein
MSVLSPTPPKWILLPALLFSSLACGDPPAGDATLQLGWTFVDGRRCADSGVEQVVLTRKGGLTMIAEAHCPVGFATPGLRIQLPSGEHELQLSGVSAAQTVLYRRTFSVTLTPDTTVDRIVDLAFTGGL